MINFLSTVSCLTSLNETWLELIEHISFEMVDSFVEFETVENGEQYTGNELGTI